MSTSNNPVGERAELKRIRNEDDRLVSFSKRRAGIYKKASETSILCGAQVGIIIFSPSDKPFTFGAPNIETVVNRFNGTNDVVETTGALELGQGESESESESDSANQVQDINGMHNELTTRLDLAKKEGTRLSDIKRPFQKDFWWNVSLDSMNLDKTEKLITSMISTKTGATKMYEKFQALDSTIDIDSRSTEDMPINEADAANIATDEMPIDDATNVASTSRH